jgi:hypothetical protein
MHQPDTSCRIYALLSRNGKTAVVFRRGPSKHVLLLRWDLETDEIQQGQWLKGRIYERLSDLSPDGELLIYATSNFKKSKTFESYCAISRPPYLTALALWPSLTGCRSSGSFQSNTSILLDNGSSPPILGSIPKTMTVSPSIATSEPIEDTRMKRDGWRHISAGTQSAYQLHATFLWQFTEPSVWIRDQPNGKSSYHPVSLRRELRGIGKRNGPFLNEDFIIAAPNGSVLRTLQNCDWAIGKRMATYFLRSEAGCIGLIVSAL